MAKAFPPHSHSSWMNVCDKGYALHSNCLQYKISIHFIPHLNVDVRLIKWIELHNVIDDTQLSCKHSFSFHIPNFQLVFPNIPSIFAQNSTPGFDKDSKKCLVGCGILKNTLLLLTGNGFNKIGISYHLYLPLESL